jgi:putative FmdB family regulatory protein
VDLRHGTPWVATICDRGYIRKTGRVSETLFFNGQEFTSMPTYDYKCTKCGHTFEAFQSMNDKPLSRCPVCKGALRRLIGGGMGVIFKGSGFYTTDYKKSSTLTGSNGGKEGSREKEKSSEKSSSERSTSDRSSSERSSSDRSSSERSSSERSSAEKSSTEKTPAT